VVIFVGVVAIAWSVYRTLQKEKRLQGSETSADSQDFLFGKGEPWWVIGAAIFAANIGSEHLVGLAGTGAKTGFGMAHWEMQGWMILILGLDLCSILSVA
jgi:SSS family solute:Na+ symporter